MSITQIAFCAVLVVHLSQIQWTNALSGYAIPNDMYFGALTSAWIIEGAWNTSGKGPSLWDNLTHAFPSIVADGTNGDVAANSYEFYMDDIAAAKAMRLKYYRLSISWPRIIPNGTWDSMESVNYEGIMYYDKVINAVLDAGLVPIVTMHNYDHPYALEKKYGGIRSRNFVNDFIHYANLLFSRFGDRVKNWITFNEAYSMCKIIYGDVLSPRVPINLGTDEYLCGKNLLLAHAAVWRMYDSVFRHNPRLGGGKVGMSLVLNWYFPASNSSADKAAADRALAFAFGWFAHPIFYGNYPQLMIDQVSKLSVAEGLNTSRLPSFTQKEIDMIYGTADFLAFDPMVSYVAAEGSTGANWTISAGQDTRVNLTQPSWFDHTGLYTSTPEGFKQSVIYAHNYLANSNFSNLRLWITEHGHGIENETLNDINRIEFMRTHVDILLQLYYEQNIHVELYDIWLLIDAVEYLSGIATRFGLYHVDFNSVQKTRTPKGSASYLRNILDTGYLNASYVVNDTSLWVY